MWSQVFVDASLAEAERRDPKGLYKKARAGEIKGTLSLRRVPSGTRHCMTCTCRLHWYFSSLRGATASGDSHQDGRDERRRGRKADGVIFAGEAIHMICCNSAMKSTCLPVPAVAILPSIKPERMKQNSRDIFVSITCIHLWMLPLKSVHPYPD